MGLFRHIQIARFMGPTWAPPGSCCPQMGPMLAPWTLLSGYLLGVTCGVSLTISTWVSESLSVLSVVAEVMLLMATNCFLSCCRRFTERMTMTMRRMRMTAARTPAIMYLSTSGNDHDDVIKWKHFPRYWTFVRGIHSTHNLKASDAEPWCFLSSVPE